MNRRSNFRVSIELFKQIYSLTIPMLFAIVLGSIGHLLAIGIPVLGSIALLGSLSYKNVFAIVIVFALLRGLFRYGEQYLNHFVAFKLLAILRDKVFSALRVLSPAKLEGKDKGDLISIITSDIELLEVFYAHTISPIAIAIIVGGVGVGLLASIHIALSIIALLAYISVGLLIPLFISRYDFDVSYRELSGDLSTFVLDSLRGLFETIQYNGTKDRLDEMLRKTTNLSNEETEMKKRKATSTALTQSVILSFDFIMLITASFLYSNGFIDFEGFLFSFVLLMSSFGPFVSLSDLGMGLQNTFASGNRVLDLLEELPVTRDVSDGVDIKFNGASMNDVSFSYDATDVLSHVDMDFTSNSVIGIMGKSGSGKSTILKLLMRFWSVDSGSVNLSDTNVEEINTESLRKNESLVSQDTYLFNDSIMNNLLIANYNASDEEVVQAAKKAMIHDLIMKLPNGYDSSVGELGDKLSAGERQRIGMARAFLHDAPFMLLDEPTSNLDSLNEAVILKSIHDSKENKTIIMVSHRQSTMNIADVVYKMDESRES